MNSHHEAELSKSPVSAGHSWPHVGILAESNICRLKSTPIHLMARGAWEEAGNENKPTVTTPRNPGPWVRTWAVCLALVQGGVGRCRDSGLLQMQRPQDAGCGAS